MSNLERVKGRYRSGFWAGVVRCLRASRWALGCLVLLATTSGSLAQAAYSIKVLESSTTFPSLSSSVEVRDSQNKPLNGLQAKQFTLLQDQQPLAPDQFTVREQRVADQGAVIGVVLDASRLLGASEVDASRQATIAFLNAERVISPTFPELVSLYVPAGESAKPHLVQDFTHDRNALINHLNTKLELEAGTTRLYAVLRDAVDAVGQKALAQGSAGYVVVLSDGRDELSLAAFDQALAAASDQRVTLLTMNFGPRTGSPVGAERLRTLATRTRGEYLDHPTPEQAADLYKRFIQPTVRTAYTVAYTSTLAADEQVHRWQILVTVDGQEIASQHLLFRAGLAAPLEIQPLGKLMQGYFLRTIPGIFLASGLLTLLLILLQRMGQEDSRRLRG